MVMAPGGNLGGNNGSLQPANLPSYPPLTLGTSLFIPIGTLYSFTPPGNSSGLGQDSGDGLSCEFYSAGQAVAYFTRNGGFRVQLAPSTVLSWGTMNPIAVLTGGITGGNGAPSAVVNDGTYYFRFDTPGVANQRIYVRTGGAWVGIV